MRFLLRTKESYNWDGFIEWAPATKITRWYSISRANLEPEEMKHQLVEKVFPMIFKTRKVIGIEGYYSQERKKLVIEKVLSGREMGTGTIERMAEEDEIDDEDVMFFEDLWSIGEF